MQKAKSRTEQMLSLAFAFYSNSWLNLKPAFIPALNAALSQAKHKVSINTTTSSSATESRTSLYT